MCGQVRPLLAELLATALFLTLASLGPGPKAISWGVSYALSTLLAGPQAVLNPALSLAMVASRQAKASTLPARILGQLVGASLSAIALIHTSPSLLGVDLSTSSLFPLLTPPPVSINFYNSILQFTLASLLLSVLICASRGSSIYQGLSLGLVIHNMGEGIGLGLNPAREVASRLVLSAFTGSWKSFLESEGWVWVPVTWSFAGALIGALLFWLLLEIPRQCETQELERKARFMSEDEEERLMPDVLITEKPTSKLITEKPKPPPAPPMPAAQWPQACFPPRTSRDETRASQLSRQLERYQSVALDKKDDDHKVTIAVGGQEEDKIKSTHEASL